MRASIVPNRRGERALELVHGRARLERRDSVHEIGNGFGLYQVQSAVEVGTQRELAGLGQPRARRHRELDDAAKQHRAAVRADLHDVFTGEGTRRGEERRRSRGRGHARRAAVVSARRCPASVACLARKSFDASRQRLRDGMRLGTRQADDADAAASGRRRDGGDGVGGGEHATRRAPGSALGRDDDGLQERVADALGRRRGILGDGHVNDTARVRD